MNLVGLNIAIAEAERFLAIAKNNKAQIERIEAPSERNALWLDPSPGNSATKRASMDLTRALSNLRK